MRLLSLIILVSLLACNEPDLADPVTVDLNGEMTAVLDGADWASGSKNSASLNFLDNKIQIEGYFQEGDIIRSHITLIVEGTSTGTFDAQLASGSYHFVRDQSTYISNNICNVDINLIDTENKFISGTFNFAAISQLDGSTIEIVDGRFEKVNLTIVE